MSDSSEKVVVLGASDKPDRYSFQALQLLREHGHEVTPVHPALSQIDGVPVVKSLADAPRPVDTLTVYVNPAISEPLAHEILALAPKRVIFNPGTESPKLRNSLEAAGIRCQEACTLVLLRTDQF